MNLMAIPFKKFFVIIAILFYPAVTFAVPSTPTNLEPVPGDEVIEVSWTANTDAVSGYYIYLGTAEDNLDLRHTISDPAAESYSFTGLSSGTTYYIAVSAFDDSGESLLSEIASTTTLTGSVPEIPAGFSITSLNDITSSSTALKWELNSEEDLDYYNVYTGIVSGSYFMSEETSGPDINSYIVTGLDSSERYYFALSAVDTSGNESEKGDELIVDTLPDENPPNVPGRPSAEITGAMEVTITFNGNNDGMADLGGYRVHYGTAAGSYDTTVDTEGNASAVISSLSVGDTYYFAVSSYDTRGNESGNSEEGSIVIEEMESFLKDADIKEGCFIATAVFGSYDHPAVKIFRKFRDDYLLTNRVGKRFVHYYYSYGPAASRVVKDHPRLRAPMILLLMPLLVISFLFTSIGPIPSLLLFFTSIMLWRWRSGRLAIILVVFLCGTANADGSNAAGIKGGLFSPSDSLQRAVYNNNLNPIALFYERRLSSNVSFEIEAGYIESNGTALTASGRATGFKTEMTLAPLAASLKWNFKAAPFIRPFLGAGFDYWFYKETVESTNYNIEVSGYHGKAGVNLFQVSNSFGDELKNTFLVLEAVYSQIDHFGDNKTDLGGLFFNLGAGWRF